MSAPAASVEPSELLGFEAAWEEFFAAAARARARGAREQPGGLSLSQLKLVLPLQGGASATVGELAENAAVAPPTATRMLDCLERDGLVTRAHATHDRRLVTIALTDAGARAVAAKRAAVIARRRELFAAMSATERRYGARLLRSMADVLDQL
jgi:DNA-binding MarR family transcriptional regulator